MTYEKLRYPLFWFSIVLNVLAAAFCSWCLVGAIGKFGFFSVPSLIDVLCVGLNVWWLYKGIQRYRDMKQMDQSIELLQQLLAELLVEQKARQSELETSTEEVTKELP